MLVEKTSAGRQNRVDGSGQIGWRMAANPQATDAVVHNRGAANVASRLSEAESTGVVVDRNGRRGTLYPAPPGMTGGVADANQVLLQFENGERLLIPRELLMEETDSRGGRSAGQSSERIYRLRQSVEELRQAGQTGEAVVIPVVEEQVDVERVTKTGRVQITKSVQEHVQVVDEPLVHEEVEIERVVINQPLAANARAAAQPRYEGNVLVIPLVEEVLVVEKRLIVKEEVRVRKVRREMHQPQEVTLRREEVTVTRTPDTRDMDSRQEI
jgi:uncharacterized protein (TIGR02271 family)